MNLKNIIVIVAGGTGGIGSEVSRLLASLGAVVIVASRNAHRSQQLLNDVRLKSQETIFVQADLRFYGEWEQLIEMICGRFGHIDVLVNCIGTLTPGRFDRLSFEDIENIVATNLGSFLYGARAVIPIMKRRHSGHIIHVGSLGGILPMPYEALYSSTKFAVRGLSLSLAKELSGTGIHLSLVSPGPVKTRMLDIESEDDESTIAFVNNVLEPAQVAKAIVDLIHKPKNELIIPRWAAGLSLILNLEQGAFSFLYPFLDFIGKFRHLRFSRSRQRNQFSYSMETRS